MTAPKAPAVTPKWLKELKETLKTRGQILSESQKVQEETRNMGLRESLIKYRGVWGVLHSWQFTAPRQDPDHRALTWKDRSWRVKFRSSLVKHGEQRVFSRLAILDFLAQSTHGTLGDFLQAEWPAVHEHLMTMADEQTLDKKVLGLPDNHILMLRFNSPVILEAQLALTPYQVKTILNKGPEVTSVPNKLVLERLSVLLGHQEDTMVRFNQVMGKLLETVPPATQRRTYDFKRLLRLLDNVHGDLSKRVYDTLEARTDTKVSSTALMEFLDKAQKRGLDFITIYPLILILSYPANLGSRTSAPRCLKFFMKVLETPKESDLLAALDTLSYVSSAYKGGLPSLEQWEGALEDGLLFSPPELVLSLLMGDAVDKDRYVSFLVEYRRRDWQELFKA